MHTTGECHDYHHQATEEVSDYNDSDEAEPMISSEESTTWDESSSDSGGAAACDAADNNNDILEPLDESQEGDLTQFLFDTFGNTDTTLNDLIAL